MNNVDDGFPTGVALRDEPHPGFVAHLALTGELGRGGMSRVYIAEDRRSRRSVAVKRLADRFADSPEYRDGFFAEAQITEQLDHPNLVPVHEMGVMSDGVPYFTMNLVRGISFAEWLRDPSRPVGSPARVRVGIEILVEVCAAVSYAHSRGVIHRDLKPENVIVAESGRAHLIDWGLARLRSDGGLTIEAPYRDFRGAVGTPSYMAPEQARGNPVKMDERSDVFGLGAILYEVLSGRVPYGAATEDRTTLVRAWNGAIVPIEQATAGTPLSARTLSIVRKAISPDPAARHQTVRELADDLVSLLGDEDASILEEHLAGEATRHVSMIDGGARALLGGLGAPTSVAAERITLQLRDRAELTMARAVSSWLGSASSRLLGPSRAHHQPLDPRRSVRRSCASRRSRRLVAWIRGVRPSIGARLGELES